MAFLGRNSDSYNYGSASGHMPGPQADRLRRSFENIAADDPETRLNAMDPYELREMSSGDGDDDSLTDPKTITDLSKLSDLSKNTVLQVIKTRYRDDHIYTACGDILISVNPYKGIPSLFDETTQDVYALDAPGSLLPHVYRTAREACVRRRRDGENQVVLVSGESGAGKTEATKLMLGHVLHLSASSDSPLADNINKVNPLIELFGNARTTLNENSSRFAKWLEVIFSEDKTVSGATIRDYILEKSRLVSPADGESNFHIMYSFVSDVMADPRRQEKFLMTGMQQYRDFRILPRHSWKLDSSVWLTSEQQADIFSQIELVQEDVDNLHTILAAILHLTNIRVVDDDQNSCGVVVQNEDAMNKAAALLGVDAERLVRVLVTTRLRVAGQDIDTFRSQAKAQETRDGMAKALYERLFGWLIRRINTTLSSTRASEANIAFLDMCGFEDLAANSLEQLCINLANEHLQGFVHQQVFALEKDVYRAEGINMGHPDPPNNDQILSMFNAPRTGLLALINEDTRLEMATDASLVSKMIANHHAGSPCFRRYKNDQPMFGIDHFAGPVWYSADDFLEKNGDSLGPEVKDALVASSNELVSDLFQVEKHATGSIAPTNFNYRQSVKHAVRFPQGGMPSLSASVVKGLRDTLKNRFPDNFPRAGPSNRAATNKTAIDFFQASMSDLLNNRMKQAKPLFVRCIKPNSTLEPDHFDDTKVATQLRYNGVMEMALVRRKGFPVRLRLPLFLTRYCDLAPSSHTLKDKQHAATTVLQETGVAQSLYLTGKTMVFLKQEAADHLDGLKAEDDRRRLEEEERQAEEKRKKEAERRPKPPLTLETVLEVPTPASSVRTSTAPSPQSSRNGSVEVDPQPDPPADPPQPATTTAGLDRASQGAQSGQEDKRIWPWDIFRVVAREQPPTDIHHMTAMKVIKLVVYVLIFVIVLATATSQKVSFMLMIASVRKPAEKVPRYSDKLGMSSAYYILLTVAICIPYMFNLLSSAAKTLFGGFSNPSTVTWIWVMVVECLHTFGLTLLVFRVLPRLDVVHGLLLLSAVAFFPSILKAVTAVEVGGLQTSDCRACTGWVLDALAVAGMLSVLPVLYVRELGHAAVTTTDGIWSQLDVAAAILLVSLAHWENFTDDRLLVDVDDMNPVKNFLLKRRYELERGRYIPQFVTSMLKIGLTVTLAYVFRGPRDFDYEQAFESMTRLHSDLKAISVIIVLTLSAMVCYYATYIACKLWMQRINFALPLTLATPLAILVFWLDYRYEFLAVVTSTGDDSAIKVAWPEGLFVTHWRTLCPGVAWWVALLILTRYVWFPRHSRLAKIKMMFMNPMYCGILTSETLLLNRRRHTLTCRKSRDALGTHTYYTLSRTERRSHETDSDYHDGSDGTYADLADTEDPDYVEYGGNRKPKEGDEEIPKIYACATMWHEVRREMVMLLKSLHRIDRDQWIRKQAQEMSGQKDKDYFEYEAHIFFDDAMTMDDDEEYIPNDYVKLVVSIMEEAVCSVYKKAMSVKPPYKIATPYGGQLLWEMPGGNLLFIHLKDKAKIRHRKRWSQVMYMYYLLGFRLTRQCQELILRALKERHSGGGQELAWNVDRDNVVGSEIFEMLGDKMEKKSHNTFVMALDGDTDFQPGAVHILLDRMKKNPQVGAACGRIHPIGSGPMVWYQMFEYAIGHWMQKATEHVLGCVLCSPGCFSLFRGSALMDDNVMRKYTILPTEPGHFLQYDQGEDRWLCTLLLQQGYRVDYAAAADAWTYAPEGFNEFFNQRRRWMPSTLANVMDLLGDYSNTVTVNSNISMLYIIYQVALMVATLLGPGTVIMMIAGALDVVFPILGLTWSYVLAVVPSVIYLFICFYCKTNIQLYVAAIMSTFYAFVMMVVFVGVFITAFDKSFFHPSVLVILFLIAIFVFAGFCHPLEMYCLPSGALYLLCVPAGYLLLVIYSFANMHNVSWGTREAPKKKTKAELAQEEVDKKEKDEEKKKKKGFFTKFFFSSYVTELKEILHGVVGRASPQEDDSSIQLLRQINENLLRLTAALGKDGGAGQAAVDVTQAQVKELKVEEMPEKKRKSVKITAAPEEIPAARPKRDELRNPKWIEDKDLGGGETMELFPEELEFWEAFILKYLKPLDADQQKEADMMKGLLELRTNVCFGVSMLNLLWIAINFMFQFRVPVKVTIPIDGGVEVGILGLLFVFFLISILMLQVVGMIIHRWGTLLHLLAFTDIQCHVPCFGKKNKDESMTNVSFQRAFEFCKRIVDEPVPDYLDDDDDDVGQGDSRQTGGRGSMAQTFRDKMRETLVGPSVLGRKSVVAEMADRGIQGHDFLRSRPVDLYLRGTHGGDNDLDMDARNYVENFRSNMNRRPDEYAGHNGRGPDSPTGDGYPPRPPRRQNSRYNRRGGAGGGGGPRNRFQGNNLRYTVRDMVEKAKGQGIQVRPPDQGFRGGVAGAGAGGCDMDRAFRNRMGLFNHFAAAENTSPGREPYAGNWGNGRPSFRRPAEPRQDYDQTIVKLPSDGSWGS